jgi:hypothetical protein
MNPIRWALTCSILLAFGTVALSQNDSDNTDVAKGIQLQSSGQLMIGQVSAEIAHYDSDWNETMQHDVFQAKSGGPTSQPDGSFTLTGEFPLSSDTFNLTEKISPSNGGIDYSATMTSDKAIDSKELSLQLAIPIDGFSGKKVSVDSDSITLPSDPQPKGQASLSAKGGVKEVDIPTPDGTLVISGSSGMNIYLQDNREWNDDHYGLRIHFNPGDGQIKQSTLNVQIKVKPATGG